MTATQFKGEVSIQAQNGQYIPATMVFDSGRGTNLVNQRYALAMGWTADASILWVYTGCLLSLVVTGVA